MGVARRLARRQLRPFLLSGRPAGNRVGAPGRRRGHLQASAEFKRHTVHRYLDTFKSPVEYSAASKSHSSDFFGPAQGRRLLTSDAAIYAAPDASEVLPGIGPVIWFPVAPEFGYLLIGENHWDRSWASWPLKTGPAASLQPARRGLTNPASPGLKPRTWIGSMWLRTTA